MVQRVNVGQSAWINNETTADTPQVRVSSGAQRVRNIPGAVHALHRSNPTGYPKASGDVALGDYVDAVQAGLADIASGAGGLVEYAGAELGIEGLQDTGEDIRGFFSKVAENQVNQMTQVGRDKINKQFLPDDMSESALTDVSSILLKLARTSPTILLGIVPGAAAASAATKANLGIKAATAAAAAAGGITEAGIVTGFVAADVAEAIDSMSDADLVDLPQYAEMLDEGYEGTELREELKRRTIETGGRLGLIAGVTTGAAGGALWGRMATKAGIPALTKAGAGRLSSAKAGFIGEAVQEGIQESSETLSKNKALGNPLLEDIPESFVGGAVLGGGTGGAVGFTMGTNADTTTEEPTGTPNTPLPSETNPEPSADIAAQIRHMLHPDTNKQGVYISAQTNATMGSVLRGQINKLVKKSTRSKKRDDLFFVQHKDGSALLTTNEVYAEQFKKHGSDELQLKDILGYSQSKSEMEDISSAVVVRMIDPDGSIAQEETVEERLKNPTIDRYNDNRLRGQSVEVVSIQEALDYRQKRLVAEQKAEQPERYDLNPDTKRHTVSVDNDLQAAKKVARAAQKKATKGTVDKAPAPVEVAPTAIPVAQEETVTPVETVPEPTLEELKESPVAVPSEETFTGFIRPAFRDAMEAMNRHFGATQAATAEAQQEAEAGEKITMPAAIAADNYGDYEKALLDLKEWANAQEKPTGKRKYNPDVEKTLQRALGALDPFAQELEFLTLKYLTTKLNKRSRTYEQARAAAEAEQLRRINAGALAPTDLVNTLGLNMDMWDKLDLTEVRRGADGEILSRTVAKRRENYKQMRELFTQVQANFESVGLTVDQARELDEILKTQLPKTFTKQTQIDPLKETMRGLIQKIRDWSGIEELQEALPIQKLQRESDLAPSKTVELPKEKKDTPPATKLKQKGTDPTPQEDMPRVLVAEEAPIKNEVIDDTKPGIIETKQGTSVSIIADKEGQFSDEALLEHWDLLAPVTALRANLDPDVYSDVHAMARRALVQGYHEFAGILNDIRITVENQGAFHGAYIEALKQAKQAKQAAEREAATPQQDIQTTPLAEELTNEDAISDFIADVVDEEGLLDGYQIEYDPHAQEFSEDDLAKLAEKATPELKKTIAEYFAAKKEKAELSKKQRTKKLEPLEEILLEQLDDRIDTMREEIDVSLSKSRRRGESLLIRDTSLFDGNVTREAAARVLSNFSGGTINHEKLINDIADAYGKGHPYGELGSIFAALARTRNIKVNVQSLLPSVVGKHKYTPSIINFERDQAKVSSLIILNEQMVRDAQQTGDINELARVYMHEFAHEATLLAYKYAQQNNLEVASNIDNLYRQYMHYVRANEMQPEYGDKNIKEFMAEALTNPDFAYRLSTIPVAKVSGLRALPTSINNLWNAFVDSVKRALSKYIASSTQESDLTVYNQLSDSLGQLLDLNNHVDMTEAFTGTELEKHFRDWSDSERVNEVVKQVQQEAWKISKHITGPRGHESTANAFEFVRDQSLSLHTRNQLYTRFRDLFDSLRGSRSVNFYTELEDITHEQQRIVTEAQRGAEEIVVKWNELAKTDPQLVRDLHQLMLDSTFYQVDPSVKWLEGANSGWSKNNKPRAKRHAELRAEYFRLLRKNATSSFVFNGAKKWYAENMADTRLFSMSNILQLEAEALGLVDAFGMPDQKQADALVKKYLATKKKSNKIELLNDTLVKRGKVQPEEAARKAASLYKSLGKVEKVTRIKGAYFPLARFGHYIVSMHKPAGQRDFATEEEAKAFAEEVNSGNVEEFSEAAHAKRRGRSVEVKEDIVEFYFTETEANARYDELSEQYKSENVASARLKSRKTNEASSSDLASLIATSVSNLPDAQGTSSTVKKAIEKAYYQMMADQTASKSRIGRQEEGIRGASTDMLRIFAERSSNGAWMAADLRTAYRKAQALKDMRKHADIKRNTQMQRVVNNLLEREERHHERGMHKALEGAENFLSKAGFYMHLASASYSMINAAQVPMIAYPYLSAKYGLKNATNALKDQWGFTGKAALEELIESNGTWKRLPDQLFGKVMEALKHKQRSDGKTSGEIEMLQELMNRQIIDATFIQEIFRAGSGATQLESTTAIVAAVQDATRGLSNMSRGMPQLVEQLNRVSVALATYQLERNKLANNKNMGAEVKHQRAIEAAWTAVDQTQLDYSQMNRPLLFRKAPMGRVLFMFAMYSQGIASLLIKNAHTAAVVPIKKALGSKDPRVRAIGAAEIKEARKVLMGLATTHTLAAGTLGATIWPVKFLIESFMRAFGDDDEWNYKDATRNFYYDAFVGQFGHEGAQKISDVLAKGLPRALGIDVHGRMGLNTLRFQDKYDYSATPQEEATTALIQLGGPVLSYFMQTVPNARKQISEGRLLAGLATASPKAVRDLYKAINRELEGIKDYQGHEIIEADKFNMYDAVVTGIGFRSAKEARVQDRRLAMRQRDDRISKRRNNLIKRWMNTPPAQRSSFYNKHIENEWNAQYPDRDTRITWSDLRKKEVSLRTSQRKLDRTESKYKPRYRSTDQEIRF